MERTFDSMKGLCKRLWKAVDREDRERWCDQFGGSILLAELIKVITYDGKSCMELSPEELEEICKELDD